MAETLSRSGKVLVDGQPAVRATVTFHPAEAQPDGKIYKPSAFTDDDGAFSLTTLEVEDGAPLGEYTVTVVATYKVVNKQDVMVPDLLHGKFADVKSSPLKITVREQDNVLEPFNLKSH